ncbi:MAG: DUF58 domain-containing protein [Rhodocyclaceae bacterium]|nr:DUF58 domain-containing protein [Rhodocyclaceae bacterium]
MLAALSRALSERFAAWALRHRPPAAGPIVLTERRIFVLPTRAGLLYALSLLVMLVGAINYNLSLGYALVFLLAGLGVVTILYTFRNLLGLVLTAGAPAPVFAGEIAHFPLHLVDRRGRARHMIRIGFSETPPQTASVPAGGEVRVLLPCPAPRRGRLAMPRATIETVWPLGLVRAWAYAAPAVTCLVYPRPAEAVWPAPTFSAAAAGRQPHDSGEEDFAGLRPHQPGDSLRHIAWKAAARLGPQAPLATKQFAGTTAPSAWFDWRQLPEHLDVEMRLSILARWVLDAEAAGLAWGLRLPGREIGLAHGSQHLHACLKALALYELREPVTDDRQALREF